jgi:hypothetical protein
MDPITLIVTALSAGAGSAVQDGASAAMKETYARLLSLARERLSRRPNGGMVLRQHAANPKQWDRPLIKALRAEGAVGDAELIATAQALLQLTDEAGSRRGKYVIHAENVQGMQIGNHNTQDNVFGPTTPPSPRPDNS